MDPMTAILTALAAGAAAALKDTASQAIKDGYSLLRGLIERKLQDNPNAEMVLKEHEKDPEAWEKPLEQTLSEAKVDHDEEIVETARQFLAAIQAQQGGGKYNVQVAGDVQGMVTGDQANVTMNFGDQQDKKKR